MDQKNKIYSNACKITHVDLFISLLYAKKSNCKKLTWSNSSPVSLDLIEPDFVIFDVSSPKLRRTSAEAKNDDEKYHGGRHDRDRPELKKIDLIGTVLVIAKTRNSLYIKGREERLFDRGRNLAAVKSVPFELSPLRETTQ